MAGILKLALENAGCSASVRDGQRSRNRFTASKIKPKKRRVDSVQDDLGVCTVTTPRNAHAQTTLLRG